MNKKKTLSMILALALVMTTLFAVTFTTASAVETLPTTADIVNPGWWPAQPLSVEDDAVEGVKITFGANTAWGIRAVGQKAYELSELEITLSNVSMPNSGAGIFFNFADANTNPASDPGSTSLFLYVANVGTGYDVNVLKRPGGENLGTINFSGSFEAVNIIKFEKMADGSWLLLFNNKSCAISKADMDLLIPDQTKACFSIGNNNTVADPTSMNIARIRNVPVREDLKPTSTNFNNPYWGAMVVIADDAVNGTSVAFAANTPWGPRAIGQNIFDLSDLEITLSNIVMTNPGAGIFLNLADADQNPASDPAANSLFFYIKNTATGYDVELIQRPSGPSLVTVSFTGGTPTTIKFGFIQNIDGSWLIRINDQVILASQTVMDTLIPNKAKACFSIGNNNTVADVTSLNVSSIKHVIPFVPTPTEPNGEPTTTPTTAPTAAPTPTPIVNNSIDVPNEGDFVNPFWPSSYLVITPLDQERGLQVDFPGTSAWGVRAIGTQEYVLDGLEMDLTDFSLSGANRQFIMMIADSKKNEASDPTGRGILMVYALNATTQAPEITLWARPFYEGDEPLATYTLLTDITDHVYFKFDKDGDNWNFSVNGEIFTITDAILKASIPNPGLVRFAPGFGATDSSGLSFIISRVTNKSVVAVTTPTPTVTTSASSSSTSDSSTPQTGDMGILWIVVIMALAVTGSAIALKRKSLLQ